MWAQRERSAREEKGSNVKGLAFRGTDSWAVFNLSSPVAALLDGMYNKESTTRHWYKHHQDDVQ